jgi:hypothetical protein
MIKYNFLKKKSFGITKNLPICNSGLKPETEQILRGEVNAFTLLSGKF